jgi:hypothetical protein
MGKAFYSLSLFEIQLTVASNADLEKVNASAPVRSPVGDTSLSRMPPGVEDPKTSTEKNVNEGKT